MGGGAWGAAAPSRSRRSSPPPRPWPPPTNRLTFPPAQPPVLPVPARLTPLRHGPLNGVLAPGDSCYRQPHPPPATGNGGNHHCLHQPTHHGPRGPASRQAPERPCRPHRDPGPPETPSPGGLVTAPGPSRPRRSRGNGLPRPNTRATRALPAPARPPAAARPHPARRGPPVPPGAALPEAPRENGGLRGGGGERGGAEQTSGDLRAGGAALLPLPPAAGWGRRWRAGGYRRFWCRCWCWRWARRCAAVPGPLPAAPW